VDFKTGSGCGGGEPALGTNKPAAARTFSAPGERSRELQSIPGSQREAIELLDCDFSNMVGRRNFLGRRKQPGQTPAGCSKRSNQEKSFPLQAH
jgi:hypothetical protein